MKIGLIVLAALVLGLSSCDGIDPKYQEESCVNSQLMHLTVPLTPEMYRNIADECARIYRRP